MGYEKVRLPIILLAVFPVSMVWYVIILYKFRRQGYKCLINHRKKKKHRNFSKENQILYAKKLVIFYRLLGHVFGERNNCLERASTLYFSLQYLGLETSLLIGKQKSRMSNSHILHAWVEVSETPINEYYGIRKDFNIIMTIKDGIII